MINKFQKSVELSHALYDEKSILRCQHFCYIWYKDRIISIGRNSVKTNTTTFYYNPKINKDGKNISGFTGTCAELNAFLRLKNKTNIKTEKCILVNIRIDNNKKLNFSHPCLSCVSLLRFLNFKKIYFSNKNEQFEEFLVDN